MRRILVSALLSTCAALAVWAQVNVGGGTGNPPAPGGGPSFLNGAIPPADSLGQDGDFYLNTNNYCLYGPKFAGAWPTSCTSLIGPGGPPLGYVAEDVAHKGVAGGYAPLDSASRVPLTNLPVIPYSQTSGVQASLGYTPDNPSNKGAPNGYAPLNGSSQVPLTNLPVIPYLQTSGVQPSLGFVPLNPANNLGDVTSAAAARANLGLTGNGVVVLSGGSVASGPLTGDVSTSGLAATVNSVGGSTAADVHSSATLASAATANNVSSAIVRRDTLGNINVTQVYAGGTPAENTTNRGAANGYAPLDGAARVPQANLPATTAINGTSVPSNSAADQTLVTTAAATGAWTTLPACPDSGGNHLNYNAATHGFLCGNTGGTAGSVQFGDVGPGTNANNLLVSGTLDYSGTGSINANQLGGVSLPGLATGLLKNTAETGSASIATFADLVATLSFTPENLGNKGAANGYAPLDAAARVPLANLPAITAINGTSVPSNGAPDQTLVTTAAATGAWAALPSCPDSSGKHLNYSTATHGFLCGNTGGTAGGVQFGDVGGGTNANTLLVSGTLGYTGSGAINANQLGGVSLPSLATGLLKNTTGTGAASIATFADLPAITAINGTSVPGNSAADQALVTTAADTGAWATLPACPDTSGNHLNYNTATHGFLCGNTGGTAGSVQFGNVGSGTNPNNLLISGTLGYTGAGSINANQLGGTSVPSNSASDQTLVTTDAAVGAWATLPACPDIGGNHLNYSAAAHAFVCGNTGGTPGNLPFGSVGSGTNANNLLVSGTLNYTGAGSINANQLGGVSLPGLATGLLKNTAGAASIANSADVVAALGFTPVNAANVSTTPTAGQVPQLDSSGNVSFPGVLNGASVVTSGDIDPAGSVYAAGNVYAGNNTAPAAGCLHLSDAQGNPHDLGICAPNNASGNPGMLTLPPAAGMTGYVFTSDGAGGSAWSALGSIAGALAVGQVPAFTGDVTNSGLTTTVGKVNGGNVPASAALLATNAGGQIVAQTTVRGSSSTPTVACGTGAGGAGTCSASITPASTNNAGSVTVTTAGTPSTLSPVLTVTFNGTVSAPSGCVMSPANAATMQLGLGVAPFIVSAGSANFVIQSNVTALTAAKTYTWWYVCM